MKIQKSSIATDRIFVIQVLWFQAGPILVQEKKVAALVTGSKICAKHLNLILKACVNCEGSEKDCFDPKKNPALKKEIISARKLQVPENYIKRAIQFAEQGYTSMAFETYDTDWDSEAYLTVSGQNSNNTVRLSDDFIHALKSNDDWHLRSRRDSSPVKTIKANDLWEQIGMLHGLQLIQDFSFTQQ